MLNKKRPKHFLIFSIKGLESFLPNQIQLINLSRTGGKNQTMLIKVKLAKTLFPPAFCLLPEPDDKYSHRLTYIK
jgi:hypothetical protein